MQSRWGKGLVNYKRTDAMKYYNKMLEHLAKTESGTNLTKFPVQDAVYPFSNEDIDYILSVIDIKDKNLLTVGSSGDQVISALARGASKITLIDGNPLALAYTELKLAGLKNLTFEEFEDYFSYDNLLNPKYYAKVSHDLSEQTQEFWNEVILNLPDNKEKLRDIYYILFQDFDYRMNFLKDIHSHYNDEEMFLRAKAHLGKCEIDFINADLSEFSGRLKDDYHLILLSNIGDYVPSEKLFQQIYALRSHVKDDGMIQMHYDFMKEANTSYDIVNQFAKFSNDKKLLEANALSKYVSKYNFNHNGVGRFLLPSDVKRRLYTQPVMTYVRKNYLDEHIGSLSFKDSRIVKRLQRQIKLDDELSM